MLTTCTAIYQVETALLDIVVETIIAACHWNFLISKIYKVCSKLRQRRPESTSVRFQMLRFRFAYASGSRCYASGSIFNHWRPLKILQTHRNMLIRLNRVSMMNNNVNAKSFNITLLCMHSAAPPLTIRLRKSIHHSADGDTINHSTQKIETPFHRWRHN